MIVPGVVASYNWFRPSSTTVAPVEPMDARRTAGEEEAFARLILASRPELERLDLY